MKLRCWRGKRERNRARAVTPSPGPAPDPRGGCLLLPGSHSQHARLCLRLLQPRTAPRPRRAPPQQPAPPSALSPRLSEAPVPVGRRTMLAVGPPLHRHGDCASQQFVAAGLAPPVPDQQGVYLGDAGVCQSAPAPAVPPLFSPTRQAKLSVPPPAHPLPLPLHAFFPPSTLFKCLWVNRSLFPFSRQVSLPRSFPSYPPLFSLHFF